MAGFAQQPAARQIVKHRGASAYAPEHSSDACTSAMEMGADSVEQDLNAIAAWATGIGPDKIVVQHRPELVGWAHAAGLTVNPWTFHAVDTTFPSVTDEMAAFLHDYGVDALFTDNPDLFPRRR